jgi:hypothetical protein
MFEVTMGISYESDNIGSNTLIIAAQPTEVPDVYNRYRGNYAYTAEWANLFHMLASNRGLDKIAVGNYQMSAEELELFAMAIPAISRMFTHGDTYVSIPSVIKGPRRVRETAAIKTGRTELVDAIIVNREEAAVEEMPTEAAVTAARAAAARARQSKKDSILKAYRLMAAPEATPESSWSNYAKSIAPPAKNHPNCLINELIEIYTINTTKTKSIPARKIIDYFKAGDDSNIARLTEFAVKYGLPLKVWTIYQNYPICELTLPLGKSQRKGFAILAFNEHSYFFTGPSVKACQPALMPGLRLPGLLSGTAKVDEITESEEAIRSEFIKRTRPCFFYKSEHGLSPQSFNYDSPHYGIDDDQSERVQIDMSKAFYESLLAAADTDLIPVFTPHDDVCAFQATDPVLSEAYYFASEACVAAWRLRRDGLLFARQNNLLLGFELRWLLDEGLINLTDIQAWKKPSYTESVVRFRKNLDEINDKLGLRHKFYLYNGILGITKNNKSVKQFELASIDASLIAVFNPDDSCSTSEHPYEGMVYLSLKAGNDDYLYLSNRHLYGFIVAQTNLQMMKVHKKMAVDIPLIRIRTDSITWLTEPEGFVQKVADLKPAFKIVAGGGKPCRKYNYWMDFINPVELAARTRVEINEWVSQHTTITGAPGVGKTYKVQHEYNAQYQHAIAFTNLCARQLDTELVQGETIHSKLRLFCPDDLRKVANELKNSTIWLDEISMVNPWIWSVLYMVGMRSKFIFTGDPNQCPPGGFGDAGEYIVDRLPWKSGALLTEMMAKATRLVDIDGVTRNDLELRTLRDAINDSENPQDELYKVLRQHPIIDGRLRANSEILDLEYHIVWGNKYRHQLNNAVAKHRGLTWSHIVGPPALRKDKQGRSYKFTASAGLKLVCAATYKKGGYQKGNYFTLATAVDATTPLCTLQPAGAAAGGPPIVIDASCLMDFRLGYAVTATSSQGMTISMPCGIHQISDMLRNGGDHRELAYTAITRLRKLSQMIIVLHKMALPEDKTICNEIVGLQDEDSDTLGTGLTPTS